MKARKVWELYGKVYIDFLQFQCYNVYGVFTSLQLCLGEHQIK